MYITSRINKVQTSIEKSKTEKFYKHSNEWYWDKIKASPLYNKSMERLKTGEGVFYKSRRDRVLKICGDNTDFVLGVLADLSTYVHSIPPAIWLSDLESLYSDTEQNRGIIAVWIRIANFYFAQSIKIVIESCGYEAFDEITQFINYHRTVFSPSE